MKNKYCLLVLLLLTINCHSQNLVQNPSFETYTSCPNNHGQVLYAAPWITPNEGSPDYYNSCNIADYGVPKNLVGYQPAHTGNCYVGGYLWQKTMSVREYVGGQLESTLFKGRTYHFEMFVNLSNISTHRTKTIGAYFSSTPINGITGYAPLSFTPQVQHAGPMFDTSNWTLVSGDFIANGGERYLIIGNFRSDSNTDTVALREPIPGWPYHIYALIDDVSLTCRDCISTHIGSSPVFGVSRSPNPFSDKLVINVGANGNYEITVVDVNSRLMLRKYFPGSLEINTTTFPSGLYFYEIKNGTGIIARNKVLKL